MGTQVNQTQNKDVSFLAKVPRRLKRGWKSAALCSVAVPVVIFTGLFCIDSDAVNSLSENVSGVKLALYGATSLAVTNTTSVLSQHFMNEGSAERKSFFNHVIYHDLAKKPRTARHASNLAGAVAVTTAFLLKI